MNIFDAHCDTVLEIIGKNSNLYKNNLHIDIEKMKSFSSYTQVFAIWIDSEKNAWENFKGMYEKLKKELELNERDIKLCTNIKDIKNTQIKKNAMIALEGAYMVKEPCDIDNLYGMGIRFIMLTWNSANRLAGGAESDAGLTFLGREAVKKAQDLGIIIDVSHLNEKSFWQVIDISRKPVIASHSNSKTLCNHKRNLTDEQFLAICKSGGCVGINYYSEFLCERGNARIEDIIKHIEHFIGLGGEDHIGLGSDFDGICKLPQGIKDMRDNLKIIESMRKCGFSENQIDKITHRNFERVVKEGCF